MFPVFVSSLIAISPLTVSDDIDDQVVLYDETTVLETQEIIFEDELEETAFFDDEVEE